MNEVELIRAQLSVERQHAAAVSHALSAAATRDEQRLATVDAFREASVDYLAWILSRFEQREQVFHDLVRARFAAEDPARNTLEAAFALRGTSREALAKLEAALRPRPDSLPTEPSQPRSQPSPIAVGESPSSDSQRRVSSNATQAAHWTDFLRFFDGAWSARRDALDALFAQQAKVTDWRAVSGIDADTIVDERNRYARVHATLPQGVELTVKT